MRREETDTYCRLGSYLLRQLRENTRKSEKVFYFSSLGLSV